MNFHELQIIYVHYKNIKLQIYNLFLVPRGLEEADRLAGGSREPTGLRAGDLQRAG